MRRRPYISGLSALFLVASAGGVLVARAPQTPRAPFRTAIDLVSLNVTVTDAAGHHISGLSADDFVVFEDGRPQRLSYFAALSTPLSVSLLIDTSSSMEQQLAVAQQAAIDFVSRLRPGDLAAIVNFDSRVEVQQPFTSDKQALESAIRDLRAGGATALYNAVYIALRQLATVKAESEEAIRRNVIVVLSDGEDTSSLVTFDQLLDLARRSQTAIYPISLTADSPSSNRTYQAATFALRQLAQETGGRLLTAKRADELTGVYGQIRDELTSQYVLGYISSNPLRDGGWRKLAVRILRPNVIPRTRAGYYSPTS
jgi:Ca-activated chloride channel family protein